MFTEPLSKPRQFLLFAFALCAFGTPRSPGDDVDFSRDVRPLLSENCFFCHGQDANHRQADLRLDERQAAIDFGAIVPGSVEASSVVERIRSQDPDLVMPPPASNRQLTDEQKRLLETWITDGAIYEDHWAFVAPVRPVEPPVQRTAWGRNAIDNFVLAKLESKAWQPAQEASRFELIKRLYADLNGLPPSPEAVAEFVNDPDPRAYEALVDRLLDEPHYGERLAIPWLDAARYADSNGFQQDGDTWQWMWRDWVVRALNEDLPFDQFTTWQLAGDLLPEATTDQQIASGFNRNHLLNGEGGAIAEEQRFNVLFDRIDTTATTWLGLTVACAQCHDHKYDPITQHDYYAMMDAFNHVPETGTPQYYSSRIRVGRPVLELPTEENKGKIAEFESQIATADSAAQPLLNAAFEGWRLGLLGDGNAADTSGLAEALTQLLARPAGELNDEEKQTLASEWRKHFNEKVRAELVGKLPEVAKVDAIRRQLDAYRNDQIPRPMVMSDAQPRETHILDRGEYLKPLAKVSFATPAFLPAMPADAPANRLGLAQWLTSPTHPLTARVQVNRMWQHFFGAGLVKTTEDFGIQSEYPPHKELLDWLAVEFRESGWSMKHMHRLIVNSATYRQSSRATPAMLEQDSDNRYFARGARLRMPAMVLRDWALSAAGLLDTRVGGVPVYPYQPNDVWEALAITKERDFTYPASNGYDLYRRSLYTFWRRTVGPANMFDASNRQTCRVRASTTSTPLHALTTLNDPTWVEAARVLAERSAKVEVDLTAQLALAFKRVLCRPASTAELERLRLAYDKQLAIYLQEIEAARALLSVGAAPRDESLDASHQAALTVVCLGIFNLDEALTRQ